jgi:glycosyltransferase involved in cell wall biosynthesis
VNKVSLSVQEEAKTSPPHVVEELHRHRVVVVIPAYNEERFIGSVVLKVLKHPVTVIVVDDGSEDDTANVAEAAGAKVVSHSDNMGYGSAITTGLQASKSYNPEAVIVLDADGQHLPAELPNVVCPILTGEADIVLGSRYLDKTSRVPPHRLIGHWFFNQLIGIGSGVKVSDSQSGYRAFSRKALDLIDFKSSGMFFASEIQFQAKKHGLKIFEVPVTIHYFDPPKRSVIAHGISVLNGVLRMIGQYRPLLFFGVPGFLILLAGLGWGWWVVDIYSRFKNLAMGYAMISVLLTILGMITLTTGIILHSVRGLIIELLKKK